MLHLPGAVVKSSSSPKTPVRTTASNSGPRRKRSKRDGMSDGCTDETIILKATFMRLRLAFLSLVLVMAGGAQRRPADPTVRLPSRGLRGAVAGGSEFATEAGMRMYIAGGNAVDAGI